MQNFGGQTRCIMMDVEMANGFLFHLLSLTNMLLSECCFSLFLFFVSLVLNPFFGVLLDKNGTKKKKWLWHNLKEHVHAPPFQPITFMITKQLSIRCFSQVSSDFKCFLFLTRTILSIK